MVDIEFHRADCGTSGLDKSFCPPEEVREALHTAEGVREAARRYVQAVGEDLVGVQVAECRQVHILQRCSLIMSAESMAV